MAAASGILSAEKRELPGGISFFHEPAGCILCSIPYIRERILCERAQGFDGPRIAQFPEHLSSPDPDPFISVFQAGDECIGCPAVPYPADSGYDSSPHHRLRVPECGYECGNGIPIAKPPECLRTFQPDFPVRVRQGLYQERDGRGISPDFPRAVAAATRF